MKKYKVSISRLIKASSPGEAGRFFMEWIENSDLRGHCLIIEEHAPETFYTTGNQCFPKTDQEAQSQEYWDEEGLK